MMSLNGQLLVLTLMLQYPLQNDPHSAWIYTNVTVLQEFQNRIFRLVTPLDY